MMITSLRIDQDKDRSRACFFRVELKEIRTVQTETSFLDPSQVPKKLQDKAKSKNKKAQKKAGKTNNQGSKSTTAAPEKSTSILTDLVGGII
jgi:hypothetical protein